MDILSAHDLPEPTNRPATPTEESTDQGHDTAGVASSAELPAEAPRPAAPVTLDQEIADLKKTFGGVGASLGGWWGKVQKQSTDVFSASGLATKVETARKDIAALGILDKAKKEAAKLQESAMEGYASVKEELEKGLDASATDEGTVVSVDGTVVTTLPQPKESKGKERAVDDASEEGPRSPLLDSAPLTSFFAKLVRDNPKLTSNLNTLQASLASLPSHVQSSVQTSLAQASNRANTAGGSLQLSEVQKLAEGYVRTGEGYLQGLGKELRELVQDAVKIVPPSDTSNRPVDRREERRRRAAAALAASGGRREALLAKLRREPAALSADPAVLPGDSDRGTAEDFAAFCGTIEGAGGIQGEAWSKKIKEELAAEDGEGEALQATFDSLVPGSIPAEAFWTRYFFRIHQIDEEEAKRRVVLAGAAQQTDEDFSWDLEDESEAGEGSTPLQHSVVHQPPDRDQAIVNKPSTRTLKPAAGPGVSAEDWGEHAAPPAVEAASPVEAAKKGPPTQTLHSGRNSSEEGTASSFDLVSAQQSADEAGKKQAAAEDDDDSDWE